MTKKRFIASTSITIASSLVFSASFAFAQDPSPINSRLKNLREKAELRAQEIRESIDEKREEARKNTKEVRETAVQKIRQVRDSKKQEAAEKIVRQLDHVNKAWTDHFIGVLDRLDVLLQKIQSRTEKAAASGKQTARVAAAIKTAEEKIQTARAAVAAQGQKTYALDASAIATGGNSTGEQQRLVSSLREQFQALRDQLHTDVTQLRDGAMSDAKTAVQAALKALSSVPQVDNVN